LFGLGSGLLLRFTTPRFVYYVAALVLVPGSVLVVVPVPCSFTFVGLFGSLVYVYVWFGSFFGSLFFVRFRSFVRFVTVYVCCSRVLNWFVYRLLHLRSSFPTLVIGWFFVVGSFGSLVLGSVCDSFCLVRLVPLVRGLSFGSRLVWFHVRLVWFTFIVLVPSFPRLLVRYPVRLRFGWLDLAFGLVARFRSDVCSTFWTLVCSVWFGWFSCCWIWFGLVPFAFTCVVTVWFGSWVQFLTFVRVWVGLVRYVGYAFTARHFFGSWFGSVVGWLVSGLFVVGWFFSWFRFVGFWLVLDWFCGRFLVWFMVLHGPGLLRFWVGSFAFTQFLLVWFLFTDVGWVLVRWLWLRGYLLRFTFTFPLRSSSGLVTGSLRGSVVHVWWFGVPRYILGSGSFGFGLLFPVLGSGFLFIFGSFVLVCWFLPWFGFGSGLVGWFFVCGLRLRSFTSLDVRSFCWLIGCSFGYYGSVGVVWLGSSVLRYRFLFVRSSLLVTFGQFTFGLFPRFYLLRFFFGLVCWFVPLFRFGSVRLVYWLFTFVSFRCSCLRSSFVPVAVSFALFLWYVVRFVCSVGFLLLLVVCSF